MNAIFSPMLIVLLKWTVLLALGWLAYGLLHQRHSRARLILWRSLFCFGLAAPLVQFAPVPVLRIPIYDAPVSATVLPEAPSSVATSSPIFPAPALAVHSTKPGVGDIAAKSLSPAPFHSAAKTIPWKSLLVLVWGLGVLLAGLRLVRLQIQLGRIRRESRPASAALQEQARILQTRLGVGRVIGVRISDAIVSPFACGLGQPCIMLPQKLAQELAPDEISALLAHEIAHFRRHDLFWCVGWRWMQAVFWFHPLVWKIPAAHQLACEEEADRAASGQIQDPDFYPQLLARLALRVLALPAVETRLALNGASQIAQRLNHLQQGKAGVWTWRHSAAGLVLAGLVFLVTVDGNFAKAALPQSLTAAPVEFKEVRVVVQDRDGRPIEGATVQPTGYRMKGLRWQDAWNWNEKLFSAPPKVKTDGQGQAFVKYPVMGNPEEKDFTGRLFLEVSHPEYVGVRLEYDVDGASKPVRLSRGLDLEVSGYVGAGHQPVIEIVPTLAPTDLRQGDWQKKENGVLTLHTLSSGAHLLQLMGRLPSGEIVYSDTFQFVAAEATNEYKFALEMKPGIRLEGRIDDQAPRPVKNGRILISVRSKEFPDSFSWQSYRTISEDGSFVFESIPPGEVDVVVLGDGFVSKSTGQIESGSRNGVPTFVDAPSVGYGVPQPFALTAPITKIEVVTEPTATLELTAKTTEGKPVAGAIVGLSPNVLRMGGIFGTMTHSSEAPFRTLAPLPPLYSATTDANGLAVVRNVPGTIRGHMEVGNPQFDLPLQGRHRSIRVDFLPGETNQAEVTLVAKGDTSLDSEDDFPRPVAPPGMSLEDRAKARLGLTGKEDATLLKLGDTLVAFIRERNPRIFQDQAGLTSDLIWAGFLESGQKGPSREEMDHELTPHLEEESGLARSVVQQMEVAGIDLKDATIQIKEASVERLEGQHVLKSGVGLTGEQFKLKLAVKTGSKAKNGASLSGEYILAANQIVRFAEGWRVAENIHWEKLPSGVLDAKGADALQRENYIAKNGTLPPKSAAPEIEFITLAGEKKMKLSELRGKIVVLDFWATWCGPCQQPMAASQTLRQTHPGWKDKVVILPMSIDDSMKIVRDHVDQRGWTNTFNAWAGAGAWLSPPAAAFRVRGVPTTYIIDARGEIVKAGHPATMDLGQEIDDLLKL